jgi:hypothetical protein
VVEQVQALSSNPERKGKGREGKGREGKGGKEGRKKTFNYQVNWS